MASRGSTRAADATGSFERLRTWLGDASGATRGGVAYLYVQSVLQLLVALVVGIFEHDLIPGRSDRLPIQLSLLIALLALAGYWTIRGHANDRLQGFVGALAYTLEGVSLCLLLAAPSPGDGDDAATLAEIERAISFAEAANSVLLAAVFAPLALTVYDATAAPVFSFVRSAEGSASEVACALLSLCVWLPWELASSLLGLCEASDAVLALAGEVEGGVQEVALEGLQLEGLQLEGLQEPPPLEAGALEGGALAGVQEASNACGLPDAPDGSAEVALGEGRARVFSCSV